MAWYQQAVDGSPAVLWNMLPDILHILQLCYINLLLKQVQTLDENTKLLQLTGLSLLFLLSTLVSLMFENILLIGDDTQYVEMTDTNIQFLCSVYDVSATALFAAFAFYKVTSFVC